MKISKILLLLVLIFFTFSRSKGQDNLLSAVDLSDLKNMMAGEFSTEKLAKADTSYLHIVLCMKPIWQQKNDGYWLYVEQSVFPNLEKPYRQRVYHLSLAKDRQSIVSRVYEIQNQQRFTGGCHNAELLEEMTPDDLTDRPGCELYLTKTKDNVFKGSTPKNKCLSSWRGASYVTSDAMIDHEKVITWDRGWNDKHEQVWGPQKQGYIFDKVSAYH
ncbi:MAG: chromophore lyase CpcT/CpeT [Bacteroidota bacterium]